MRHPLVQHSASCPNHLGRLLTMAFSAKGMVLAVVLISLTISFAAGMIAQPRSAQPTQPARACLATMGLDARIAPLADEVSNGTRQFLDASPSTAAPGMDILNYTWIIEFEGVYTYGYVKTLPFKFEQLGLYKITLIVSNTTQAMQSAYAINFTAVYSILDADQDSLPDWWEMHYFGNLDQTGAGDFDHDGYTNLEEYAKGQDPTVKDAQPGFVDMIVKNWVYVVAIAAVIVVAFIYLYPRYKKKQKDQVKKKIEAAIEIEKALDLEK